MKIRVSKNGPYKVKGRIPISEYIIIADSDGTAIQWKVGNTFDLQDKYNLCRCGQSKDKPFCDGTHLRVGFDGSETANDESYLDAPKEIDGPELKLYDFEEICASARFCHRDGGIWNLVPKSNDPKKKQIALEESYDCPSGRLVIFDKKSDNVVEPCFKESIGLIEDPMMGVSGPIWVRSGIVVESAEGKPYKLRERITLCRCGKSKNKPFCDSSHYPEAEMVEDIHKE
jgi:CDGSH-type Zn-finger protein